MKVKRVVPKGIIALICALSSIYCDDSVCHLQEKLLDIAFNERGEYIDPLYVDAIFGPWAIFEPYDDNHRKIIKEVLVIIKNELFDYT